MKNICIVAGARPNFVKVAPLVWAIGREAEAACSLVYAGRRDDATLEASLFEDLEIAPPDVYLGVDGQSLNEITAGVTGAFDQYLASHATDVVIVVDDLASTMAAAIAAKKRGVRLAHLVAGTRSFDAREPKEINRLVIDALSDYLFTAGVKSCSVATREQQSEGSQTYLVGNILMDTLRHNHARLRQPAIVDGLRVAPGDYVVLTLNRRALLADEQGLRRMLDRLAETGATVVAPLRGEARGVVGALYADAPGWHLVDPLPYLEFGWLTAHARGIVTDSGNVAEEATFNQVPCITLNSYTEHLETVTVGSNVLVGGDPEKFSEALRRLLAGRWKKCALPDRWDGRAADRIVQTLLG